MRILVFGASGRTGQLFTSLALAAGHQVTAFVRDPARLGPSRHAPGLSVAVGDALDAATMNHVMPGHDVVVSLLAPRHERDERIYSVGTANIISVMRATGVRRLIAVSAEGVRVARRDLPLGYRVVMLLPGLDAIYDDIGHMEDAVMASDLDWTLVRPAVLTDGPTTGKYRVFPGDTVPDGVFISRADLASFLLRLSEAGEYVHGRVALAD
jgi:putative NADH-flavin reductase